MTYNTSTLMTLCSPDSRSPRIAENQLAARLLNGEESLPQTPTPCYRHLSLRGRGRLTTNGIHLNLPVGLSNEPGPPYPIAVMLLMMVLACVTVLADDHYSNPYLTFSPPPELGLISCRIPIDEDVDILRAHELDFRYIVIVGQCCAAIGECDPGLPPCPNKPDECCPDKAECEPGLPPCKKESWGTDDWAAGLRCTVITNITVQWPRGVVMPRPSGYVANPFQ